MFETYLEQHYSYDEYDERICEVHLPYENMRCTSAFHTFYAVDIDLPYSEFITEIHSIGEIIQKITMNSKPSYYLTEQGCHIVYPDVILRTNYSRIHWEVRENDELKLTCLGHWVSAIDEMIIRVGRKYDHSDIVKVYSGDCGEVIEAHDRFITQFHTKGE